MKQRRSLFLLLAVLALIGVVWAYLLLAMPSQRTLDQRVYDVASQLKCPVCQGETVADSSASVSEQMRLVIRRQLQEGWSEQQILQYFASRYGNQILLAPPHQGFNLLAWLVPGVVLLLGLVLLSLAASRWRSQGQPQIVQNVDQERKRTLDDPELEHYRVQLEKELADDDPLFGRPALEMD